jgi:hypothetical protein
MQNFNSLSEREIRALAISLEEEDERVYADFAEDLRQDSPASAGIFDGMRVKESTHPPPDEPLSRDIRRTYSTTPQSRRTLTLITEGHVPDDIFELAKQSFSDEELVNLTLAVITINGWNRLAISFRSVPGTYQPRMRNTVTSK